MRVTKQPVPFADGIWLDCAPVRILGMGLTATMSVVRLPRGNLLVHSPVPLTPERQAAVAALGPVAHIYAPNTFHHMWIDGWLAAFPQAKLHAPAGLQKKRPELSIARLHGSAPEPDFGDWLEEITVDGFRLEEAALFYRPQKTLIVADLVHNIGHPAGAWTKFYASAMGFYGQVALSRIIRWTSFSDKQAAANSIHKILQRPIERLVVGHGDPLETNAAAALRNAYEWLPGAAS